MQTEVKTLIIGFEPAETAGMKPGQIRQQTYFTDLLAEFGLADAHFISETQKNKALDEVNPFVVIVFSEYTAREVNEHKPDVFIYVIDHASSIFYRKIETEAKLAKQRKTFEGIAWLVNKLRSETEESDYRKIARMTSDDHYKLYLRMMMDERPEIQKQGWELMNNDVWKRARFIVEAWQRSNPEHMEQFLCIAMDDYIEIKLAQKISDFTELDGRAYHQYIFFSLDGYPVNNIRRIPIAQQGDTKYSYEALLTKFDTPTGPRLLMEVGNARTEQQKYLDRLAGKNVDETPTENTITQTKKKPEKQIKYLTITELRLLLNPLLEQSGYAKFEFGLPLMSENILLDFTVQDDRPGRDQKTSLRDLKALLKSALKNTNWGVVDQVITYRLGFLKGQIQGLDNTSEEQNGTPQDT